MKRGAVLGFVGQIVGLMVGVGLWGWWLAALGAPAALVVLAGLLLVYGLEAGWGSVVPTSAAVSVAIALVVTFDIFPPFWPDHSHYKYWAYTVLLLWAASVALVCLLAAIGHRLRPLPPAIRWGGRLTLGASALGMLGLGYRLYQAHWPGWILWA
ncbi:hypothetical protein PGN35_010895 [Nodosilinea sp. PGN35]|uniref:hypothetical protein n=1 Tax=Nodosilinea sp. PGN35 TaxID=3020489 RepID=UPI0023B33FAB|nr:hypothetical protein [Nodosilinea sp. TSF1-S3]MDF0366462.1 hypothetical protein [Nodosilinea sp. TSF1-S3]